MKSLFDVIYTLWTKEFKDWGGEYVRVYENKDLVQILVISVSN